MDCAGISILDDAADGLIATNIDVDRFIANNINSTDYDNANILDDAVDGLMMLV